MQKDRTKRLPNGRFQQLVRITLLSSVTILSCSIAFADYRDFSFSEEKPYYFEDGKVDFGTYNGFRRYHSECHVCHGPAGLGSSYAPALMKSMSSLSYGEFVSVIAAGRVGMNNSVMPGFAGNQNVTPYINDLYGYLKARADGVVGVARPQRFPKIKK